MGPLNLREALKVIGTPPIYRQVSTSWEAGRGLEDLVHEVSLMTYSAGGVGVWS